MLSDLNMRPESQGCSNVQRCYAYRGLGLVRCGLVWVGLLLINGVEKSALVQLAYFGTYLFFLLPPHNSERTTQPHTF